MAKKVEEGKKAPPTLREVLCAPLAGKIRVEKHRRVGLPNYGSIEIAAAYEMDAGGVKDAWAAAEKEVDNFIEVRVKAVLKEIGRKDEVALPGKGGY